MGGMTRRSWSIALAALFGALLTLALPAAPASAHALLERTAPVADSVVDQLPGEITLTFSEPVRIVADKIRVTAPDGSRADTGKPVARDTELVIPLKAGGPKGTYLVSYRVISADSHPVSGGYSFSYGQVSAVPGAGDSGQDVKTDALVKNAMSAARFIGFIGLILLVGPTLVLFALWPRRLCARDPGRVALAGAGLLAAGAVLELYLQIPYTSGTTLFDVSSSAARDVLSTPFGAAHLVRLAVAAAVAVLLRPLIAGRAGKTDQTLLIILGVVGLATWPISGHPSASPVPTLTVVADAAHLAAMSVWLGGLVMLFAFLLRRADTRELTAIVPVWSGWAMLAITVLVLAGTAQALVEIGTLDALTGTTYGQLVMTKVGLLAVVLAVAAYSRRITNRRFTPAPASDDDDEPEDEPPAEPAEPADRSRLRRAVMIEVLVAVVVLGFTSVLVQTTPARSAQAGDNASQGPFTTTVSTNLVKLEVDVSPGRVGPNTVHLYALKPDGSGPQSVAEWKATAALPSKGIEPIVVPLLGITPDHASGSVTLTPAGTWELKFTVRVDELNQTTIAVQVPVRG
ncbi:copper resistance protein CopC/CopD [Dactylosporangium aurantiacum]|uniref:Copper resistance protein CopC/CopD n=1 Tax=Dactylosporangium aurantiacum TaxID=35754 RepID=A0A9Q9MGI1_9ACTN|nr:copper resistance protein CopC [Dactylosporangium aurantiacum]MDG6108210.1 copper resistance protein CopC [Dactylosporangium aurantiacum]UWZ53800.1 copper resistance protein CopC/CopD [Dactylosporangium aurantiacum]